MPASDKTWKTSIAELSGDTEVTRNKIMKTISIAEFQALVERDEWRFEQDYDVVDRISHDDEWWREEDRPFQSSSIITVNGWASKTSTLDDIKITYTEGFDYNECDPDSLSTGIEGQSDVWSIEGILVVDEDGEKLNAHELADYLSSEFSSIDYSVLEIEQVTNIDIDEDSDMETFTLESDNEPNIRFTGELIAHVSSSENQAMGSSYSGQTGRWTVLELYKTKGGKFVCHQIGRTKWQGERDRYQCKVVDTQDEVIEFFGHRWLAKELYEIAGIDCSVEID